MSHKKNRSLKFAQGTGYAVLSGVAAVGTVVLATATVGLAMSVVGIPLAFVTGVGTAGCAAGTVYCGYKAGHKFSHAFESSHHENHHHHYLDKADTRDGDEGGAQTLAQVSEPDLSHQVNFVGSSKPFFASPSRQKGLKNSVMDSVVSSVVEDAPEVAKAAL
ncbi:hypothetical protein [Legionella worsleiensis]|uniref:Transmembrane protein n=1 Tax=Legionella worsleiensis TaxID=45076 RepID=A0A0W1AL95_9GAMM|nr:hypothetical protein [Legionella worsleiensis]KTD82089.1 hypothetical protein Lwor_0009 [Legionella worsleiensis]STY31487.1 Uncharacterised protein [Legionella worsleiensis]